MSKKWIEVTVSDPCKICGRKKWCSYTESEDGRITICRKVQLPNTKVKLDRHGEEYYIYFEKENCHA